MPRELISPWTGYLDQLAGGGLKVDESKQFEVKKLGVDTHGYGGCLSLCRRGGWQIVNISSGQQVGNEGSNWPGFVDFFAVRLMQKQEQSGWRLLNNFATGNWQAPKVVYQKGGNERKRGWF